MSSINGSVPGSKGKPDKVDYRAGSSNMAILIGRKWHSIVWDHLKWALFFGELQPLGLRLTKLSKEVVELNSWRKMRESYAIHQSFQSSKFGESKQRAPAYSCTSYINLRKQQSEGL